MSGERATCKCGRVPTNSDGLCATCVDEIWDARNDLVERLRAKVFPNPAEDQRLREVANEAADEIVRLRYDLGQMTIRCRYLLRFLDPAPRELAREEWILLHKIREDIAPEHAK